MKYSVRVLHGDVVV